MADQQALQVYKKDELKTWPKCHGLKVSGRKEDLISGVTNAQHDDTELIVNRKMREKNEREKRTIYKLKDHVKSVLRISCAHNKGRPTDINIAQILHLTNFFELKRSLVYIHLQ
jgi:predicted aldo/keto reductase-like oxidoreductase